MLLEISILQGTFSPGYLGEPFFSTQKEPPKGLFHLLASLYLSVSTHRLKAICAAFYFYSFIYSLSSSIDDTQRILLFLHTPIYLILHCRYLLRLIRQPNPPDSLIALHLPVKSSRRSVFHTWLISQSKIVRLSSNNPQARLARPSSISRIPQPVIPAVCSLSVGKTHRPSRNPDVSGLKYTIPDRRTL